ncbi:MAG: hypothetical protein ACKOWD_00810 [Rhodoferax sp.]
MSRLLIKNILLIFILSANCQAKIITGTYLARNSASVKIRTLLSDCMLYKKIDKFTVYLYETPPDEDSSSWQKLYAMKWRDDYGATAKAVVKLRWDELNRFNEPIPKEARCIFHGENYEIFENDLKLPFKLPS